MKPRPARSASDGSSLDATGKSGASVGPGGSARGSGAKADGQATFSLNGQVLGGVASATGSGGQSAAAAIRKRRSSINVYDQPSSLNSRLRQLETDMLRLDEDRTKLYDDTHSALANFELRLSEIHAILKRRQDNVEKYVEDMRALLAAKDEFERTAKALTERQVSFRLASYVGPVLTPEAVTRLTLPTRAGTNTR